MKWDLDSHTSSRSLTHPAGNLNNKPAARNDHTAQPETEPALNRFALKPLALGPGVSPRSPVNKQKIQFRVEQKPIDPFQRPASRAAFTEDTQHCFGVPHLAYLSD